MRRRIKIYLDTSVYNRPFDDQSQARIRLEAEAFLTILEKTMAGAVSIISSSVLAYENSLSPFKDRKERVSTYVAIASRTVKMNDAIKKRAIVFEQAGFDSLDAMHLACAEFAARSTSSPVTITSSRKPGKIENQFHYLYAVPLNF